MLIVEGLRLERDRRLVLDGASLRVDNGESVAVVGVSGSGKTTLLHCIAGLLKPAAGVIQHNDVVLSGRSPRWLAEWRLRNCGLVFQFGELLPELTLRENVELPLRLLGRGRVEAGDQAAEFLSRVGIADHGGRLPSSVSGGQMQRAAIARAVVTHPHVLLADEPTGALDAEAGAAAAQLLVKVACEVKSAAIIVTHNPAVAALADRRLELVRGKLVPVA